MDLHGKCNRGFLEDLVGGSVLQLLSGPIIEIIDDKIKLFGGDDAEVGFLGQELSEQAVGILIDGALPSAVGMGEEDGEFQGVFEGLEAGEFLAVVDGEGMDECLIDVAQTLHYGFIEGLGGGVRHLVCNEIEGFALDKGRQAAQPLCSEEGIAFPVADAGLFVNDGRTLLDGDTALDPGVGVSSGAAFAERFPAAAQVAVQFSALISIAGDVAVDGLMRDPFGRVFGVFDMAQASGDLFRGPAQLQFAYDVFCERGIARLVSIDHLFPPLPVLEIGPVRTVLLTERVAIAPQFAGDRAATAS